MNNEIRTLQPGDNAYHLRSGRPGTVLHVSARRGAGGPRHADGRERSYPVSALRVYGSDGEPTVRCRVEASE